MMLHSKYKGSSLGLVVSDKMILKVFILKIYFSLCDLDMQNNF